MNFASSSNPRRSTALAVLGLLAVAGGYYAGGLIGLQFRIPPATPSILWPPNAILTAALLVTPPRRWGLCLLAALPAHVIAELPTDWSLAFILTIFVTNCSEALIAAGGVRLFSDSPARFDTLRRLAVFVACAVLAAPLLSSFADAAAVHWLHGESYWLVWRNRLTANVLAELTIVPAIVGLVTHLPAWVRRVPVGRGVEAGLLCSSLVVTGFLVVTEPIHNATLVAVLTETSLALQLPLILWAALRFGTVGASLALLVTTLLTSWTMTQGHGPIRGLPPGAAVLAVQLLMTMVGVTFITLATIIEERRETARALAERLRFEELLAKVSATFVELPSDRMTAAFGTWLERLGAFLGVDCLRLFSLSAEADNLEVTSTWTAPGIKSAQPLFFKREFPWVLRRILDHQPVIVETTRVFPADALVDAASFAAQGYKAALVLPLIAGDRVLGAIAFGSVVERIWPEKLVTALHLLASVFANAFVRKQTEDALRASELMKSAILESLASGIAVIDPEGRVQAVNDNWRHFLEDSEIRPAQGLEVGENLLAGLRASPWPRVPELVKGTQAVLDGSRELFLFEHISQNSGNPRWWIMQAVRLKGPDVGTIITYSEITEHRRAEQDVQRARQELAHVTRVSTMGVLTVALAHQLNQPLAAIMSNAQAARRLLGKKAPDLADLDEILSDIVDDDRRASNVIRHVRELLHKGDSTVAPVDLAGIVRDVAALVSSDALIRNVVMTLDVASAPLMVRADPIQLQQVVLNLLMNSLESIDDVSETTRTIRIRCQQSDGNRGKVIVRDSGPGFSPEARELVFEPFFTTKPGGTGMGLSIARSIVDAHDGEIRAHNAEEGGAIVEFTLPLDRSAPPS